MPGSFLDSNVLLYLASSDIQKADRAEKLLLAGGTISVQVLNEIANVLRRKLGFEWSDVHGFVEPIRELLNVVPVTVEINDLGLDLAQRHNLSLYDAFIVAAAILSDCETYQHPQHRLFAALAALARGR
jgi:predicted nucleic acid-binding protein